MNKKTGIHIFTVLLVLSVLFIPLTSVKAQAKGREGISSKKLILYTNMTKELKIQDPKEEVQWKSSNEKLVSVLGTKGSKNRTAVLYSRKKVGACTITAKVGDKIYKCRVIVKRDTKVSRATLVSVKQTAKSIKVKVKLKNKTNHYLVAGYAYWVEKFENGKWKKMRTNGNRAFPEIAIEFPPNQDITHTYDIASDDKDTYYFREDFTKGIYRLCIDVYYGKKAYRSVIFRIK